MKKDNLDKLVGLLILHLKTIRKDETPAWNIDSPQYSSLYFEVFLDEANTDGSPVPYDKFYEQLYDKITAKDNVDSDLNGILDKFRLCWNSWNTLYLELDKRGLLKHDNSK